MQDDRIHWNGQPVAIVLAETQEQADHAKRLIRVAMKSRTVTSLAAAKAKGSEPGVFMGEPLEADRRRRGGSRRRAAQGGCPYTTPRHNHDPIELHGCTLPGTATSCASTTLRRCGGRMTAWTIAQVFGLEEDQVRLTSPFVGGGFGSKPLWQHQILAAAAAKLAGRPVRIMLSREGVFRIVGGRTVTEQRVALGAQSRWPASTP